MPNPLPKSVILRLSHDDTAKVFINGKMALHRPAFAPGYANFQLAADVMSTLKPGADNVIAVRSTQVAGAQIIDVGLYAGK